MATKRLHSTRWRYQHGCWFTLAVGEVPLLIGTLFLWLTYFWSCCMWSHSVVFIFQLLLMLLCMCTCQEGLSTELRKASRTCLESQNASTKNCPPPSKLGVEMCLMFFWKTLFLWNLEIFLFENSEYETEYFIFYFLEFQWLGLYMYSYEVPLCSP